MKILLGGLLAGLALLSGALAPGASANPRKFELSGDAERGARVYGVLCARCHGQKGDGRGPSASLLEARPGDFTNVERMEKLTDEQIYTVIRDGGLATGRSRVMVAWKAILKDQQIRDVAAYVRGFARAVEPSEVSGKLATP